MSGVTDEPKDSLAAVTVVNFPKQQIVTSFGYLSTLHLTELQYHRA